MAGWDIPQEEWEAGEMAMEERHIADLVADNARLQVERDAARAVYDQVVDAVAGREAMRLGRWFYGTDGQITDATEAERDEARAKLAPTTAQLARVMGAGLAWARTADSIPQNALSLEARALLGALTSEPTTALAQVRDLLAEARHVADELIAAGRIVAAQSLRKAYIPVLAWCGATETTEDEHRG